MTVERLVGRRSAFTRRSSSSPTTSASRSAGLIDELQLNIVPVLLGEGARLFDQGAGAGLGLEQVAAIDAPGVAHLKYRLA